MLKVEVLHENVSGGLADVWCCDFDPHEPPQAAALFNTKGLSSGLDRTRGVVEHYRAPVQEEQPQRTAAVGGPQEGRPLTSNEECPFGVVNLSSTPLLE